MRLISTAMVCVLLAGGCDQQNTTPVPATQSAPPPPAPATPAAPPPPAPRPAMPGSMTAQGPAIGATPLALKPGERFSDGGVSWVLPDGWVQFPGSGMRFATLRPGAAGDASADIAVTAFGGAAGGVLANVNRWRGQVMLPPLTDAQLAAESRKVAVDGGEALVVDIKGENARILAALLPTADKTWFFKLQAPTATIEPHAAAFEKFVASIQIAK